MKPGTKVSWICTEVNVKKLFNVFFWVFPLDRRFAHPRENYAKIRPWLDNGVSYLSNEISSQRIASTDKQTNKTNKWFTFRSPSSLTKELLHWFESLKKKYFSYLLLWETFSVKFSFNVKNATISKDLFWWELFQIKNQRKS